MANTYNTDNELKSLLGISDTTDDVFIATANEAGSRWVDAYCGRHFYQVTETRYFVPVSTSVVYTDDFITTDDATPVTLTLRTDTANDGAYATTWSASDYVVHPINRGERVPATEIQGVGTKLFPLGNTRAESVKLTATFGWAAVPPQVKQAALIVAADLFKTKDARFGFVGIDEYGATSIRENRAVITLLERFRRMNGWA